MSPTNRSLQESNARIILHNCRTEIEICQSSGHSLLNISSAINTAGYRSVKKFVGISAFSITFAQYGLSTLHAFEPAAKLLATEGITLRYTDLEKISR
jgi:hypothetical protein